MKYNTAVGVTQSYILKVQEPIQLYPKMSSILNQAEASTSLYQKKMRECTIYKSAGSSEQLITFQNMVEDSVTGKTIWKPIN